MAEVRRLLARAPEKMEREVRLDLGPGEEADLDQPGAPAQLPEEARDPGADVRSAFDRGSHPNQLQTPHGLARPLLFWRPPVPSLRSGRAARAPFLIPGACGPFLSSNRHGRQPELPHLTAVTVAYDSLPMHADDNAVFRGVTVRMCGSLDLAAALEQTLGYLRTLMPADAASLHVFERDLGAVRRVAHAPNDEGSAEPPSPLAALTAGAREALDRGSREPVQLVNRLPVDPVSSEVASRYDDARPQSLAILRLASGGERLGALVLRAEGEDRFLPEHGRLLALLREPFTIALSHALRFEEVARLRDQLAEENRDLHRQLRGGAGEQVVGAELGLRGAMELVRKVAPSASPVLLLGETGVGKEVIANELHRLSRRADGPLVRVNCGALPGTLIDSELFGHERGAFTGAVAQRRGRFERADGGTIFLDEIGELPLEAQTRLLRVLQDGELERVGSSRPLKVDVRVIAATHRDLRAMIRAGGFREDLWFRLSVFPVRVPALRERREDIPALTHHFLERKARELGLGPRPTMAPGAIDALVSYGWPGNVRELQNVIERALLLAQGRPLEFGELAGEGRARPLQPEPAAGEVLPLEELTARHLVAVLARAGGRIEGPGGAAELLGLNPSTLRHRLRRLGIAFGRAAAR